MGLAWAAAQVHQGNKMHSVVFQWLKATIPLRVRYSIVLAT